MGSIAQEDKMDNVMEARARYFGLDKYGRPNLPPMYKLWTEDGGYKGYLYDFQKNRFYFNDIPSSANGYWETLAQMAYSSVSSVATES